LFEIFAKIVPPLEHFRMRGGAGLSLGSLNHDSLTVLRQIDIKIIFPREDRFVVDLGIERESRLLFAHVFSETNLRPMEHKLRSKFSCAVEANNYKNYLE
jgi:hypothetical protein